MHVILDHPDLNTPPKFKFKIIQSSENEALIKVLEDTEKEIRRKEGKRKEGIEGEGRKHWG